MGTGERRLKRLIITADDFGLSVPVNEAVEDAHRRGILTTASLMVGAAAAADAVARAGKLPDLAVGLHLVTVDGRPVLPPERIPDLVDRGGRLSRRLALSGCRYFFLPRVRRQLAEEIRAQFQAFRDTGLSLDHVNTHHHMHLHPAILEMIIRIGADFGLRAVRLPAESFGSYKGLNWSRLLLSPWIAHMRRRISMAGLLSNERIFGLHDTGRLDSERLLEIVRALPDGDHELFLHPAAGPAPETAAVSEGLPREREYRALVDPRVTELLQARDIRLIAFRDLSPPHPA